MSLTMSSITSEEAKELTVPLKKPDHLLAVPDHRVNYKRRTPPIPPRKNNCCKRALIFLSFIFCLSTLALVGILLWREFSHKECQEGLLPVQEKFPGYFRTKDQQKEFKKMVKKFSKPVPVDTSLVMGYECETKCSAYNYVNVTTTTADVRLENSDLCCESSVKYVALRNLTNLQGVTRVLSRGNDTLQYFPIHTCRQNSGCKGCQCVQTPRIFTAVYENRVTTLEGGAEVEHALDWFSLPDNCHCRAHT